MSIIKKLASQSVWYGLSTIVGRFLNYFLTPLLTYTFLPPEYGIISYIYAIISFANILFTYELTRRLAGTTITVNALHPGLIATDIFRRNYGFLGPLIKWIISRYAITLEAGADNTVFLAASAEVEGVTGKYFVKRNAVTSAPLSYDQDLAKRLWEVSEKLTGIP